MTAIVGLQHDGKVWIGGDSAGVDSRYGLTVRADEKVFTKGDAIFGFTSSFRLGNLLRFSLTMPTPYEKQEPMDFMVTRFIPELKTCLKDGGYIETDKGVESGGTFLMGWRGVLYTIYGDFQVAQSTHPFAAVGCGDMLCLGAMYAQHNVLIAPEKKIELALHAAEQFSGGVRGPFKILSI